MSLSHSVQKTDKQNASLKPIIQFLDTINDVPQKYGSFEKAEQAIKELVVELEKSMVQETLSQYDINTPLTQKITFIDLGRLVLDRGFRRLRIAS